MRNDFLVGVPDMCPWGLRPGNFDPQFFREPLANFLWQSVVNPARSFARGIQHSYRSGGGYRYAEPDQHRQSKSR